MKSIRIISKCQSALPRAQTLSRSVLRPSISISSISTASRQISPSCKQFQRNLSYGRLYATSAVESRGRKVKGVRSVGLSDGDTPATARKTWAYCTAEGYNFTKLKTQLEQKYSVAGYLVDDVFHIRLVKPTPNAQKDSLHNLGDIVEPTITQEVDFQDLNAPEAFIFENGTFVVWGATSDEIQQLRLFLQSFEVNPVRPIETEWFDFVVDPDANGGMLGETIVVGSDLPPAQTLLAFSSGLSRSVKLATLENMLDQHLDETRWIPESLRKGTRLKLSRDQVLKRLGELLTFRGMVNHHSELLDSPDFLWSNARMEEFFERVSRNLDIRPRIAVFNKKLDYANELAEFLSNHLGEQHSWYLEWIIIVLIAVEVISEGIHYAERLGYMDLDKWAKKKPEDTEKVVVGWRKEGKGI